MAVGQTYCLGSPSSACGALKLTVSAKGPLAAAAESEPELKDP